MDVAVAVTHFEIKPEKLGELKGLWEPLLQGAGNQKGFHKGILLTTQNGKCMAIGFWSSLEDAKKWQDTSFYKDFTRSLGQLSIQKSEREVYTLYAGDLSEIVGEKKAA